MARSRRQRPVKADEPRQYTPGGDRAVARVPSAAAANVRRAQRSHVLRLQRALGNQAAGRVLYGVQRQAAPRAPAVTTRSPAGSGSSAAPSGRTVTLYFAQNGDQPGSELKKLDRLMLLITDPAYSIRLDGHASTEGTHRYNDDLSGRRASAIETYLLIMGVDTKRIERHAYGERRPAVPEQGNTPAQIEQCRAQNRRVEVTLTRAGGPDRRLEGLQQWLNRTRDRFEKMAKGDEAGLQKARALLAKRAQLAGRIPPILIYDAERQVSYHEISLKSIRKTLEQLREAFANPNRAKDVLRRRRSYFRWMIKAKLEWRVKSAAAPRRARQALRSASSAVDKAFWREVVELYKDSIARLTEDVFWLRRQQLEDERRP